MVTNSNVDWLAGLKAGEERQPRDSCPFKEGDKRRHDWLEGYDLTMAVLGMVGGKV